MPTLADLIDWNCINTSRTINQKNHTKIILALTITGIDAKHTKCCGLSGIMKDDRVSTCCGSGQLGKKFDKRFQSCCSGRNFAELYSEVSHKCCNRELIDVKKEKCIKTQSGIIKSAPLNLLDYLRMKVTPDWLKCSKPQSGRNGMIPAGCDPPKMDWADVYDDNAENI